VPVTLASPLTLRCWNTHGTPTKCKHCATLYTPTVGKPCYDRFTDLSVWFVKGWNSPAVNCLHRIMQIRPDFLLPRRCLRVSTIPVTESGWRHMLRHVSVRCQWNEDAVTKWMVEHQSLMSWFNEDHVYKTSSASSTPTSLSWVYTACQTKTSPN